MHDLSRNRSAEVMYDINSILAKKYQRNLINLYNITMINFLAQKNNSDLDIRVDEHFDSHSMLVIKKSSKILKFEK